VLALNAAVIFLFYHLCSRSFSNIAPSNLIALNKLKELGTPIVKLGAVLMCSNGIMTIYSLALNSFINRVGSMSDVGLYNGAVTCTYGNIIVLVSILSADFYPRLSACIDNKTQFQNIVNQQLELLLLIAAPLISLLIIFPKFVVDVLLSSEYHSIISMISLMALSLIFRIIWHTFSFVILAHGHRKTYFWFDAILGNGLVFVMNLIAYNLWGLDGLAYSYICGAMLMVAVLAILMHKKYELQLNRNVQWLALLAIVAVCAEYILKQAADKITVIPSVVLLIIISLFALVALNRKVQFVKLKSDKQ
ncbi:MAG: oligosaccharide flippase family protein, partial [Rikenellaceae bacterium]|nr:oligosaccharide flippase family protein [Rikenellaceae bacterium]